MTEQPELAGMPPAEHPITFRVAGDVLAGFRDPAGLPRVGDALRLPQKQATVTRVTRSANPKKGGADVVTVTVTVDRLGDA